MESTTPGALTLAQQFKLQTLRNDVDKLSVEDARNYVIEVMRQMMVKDNLVKHLLKTKI